MLIFLLAASSCSRPASSEETLPVNQRDGIQVSGSEQAVIVHLKLKHGAFGSQDELSSLAALEDDIAEAVDRSSAGEFDGNEIGGGEFTLFMYGSDADRLFKTIEPLLRNSPAAIGGWAIKRYGEANDASARELRVNWETGS